MKKNIYGIVDSRTGNFGDICILDRDEEFRDGCMKLFLNSDVPKYIVEDLIAVRYGFISHDSKDLYPQFSIDRIPTIILAGCDVVRLRKDFVDTSDVEEIFRDPLLSDKFIGDDDDEEIC